MKTNEELAAMVQAGDQDALLTLWEQVRRLVLKYAHRWSGLGGLDVDDLMQVGFIAVMEAANTYDGSAAFSTWLGFYLKKEFTVSCYQRTERQRREPLLNAVSLSMPVGEGFNDDETALEDTVADPAAAAALEDIDENDRSNRLYAALDNAIAELPDDLQEAIRGKYWRQETVSTKAHNAAIRALRHPRVSRHLAAFM